MVCQEESSSTIDLPTHSSSFAESSFRELDDAFLQTQTRIWLGEVLQIRLDDQLVTSELLADGELLFQVSKVIWKLLLEKHKLRHIKAYKNHPFSSKRNSGIYRPYSNVDSFLKICKILGLIGIDLFTPSDVVERKNTRRVCMCVRSFSKKARSVSINVPDFDIVTCMVAMPKDMVGCIRRSIELSQSINVDSSGQQLQKPASRKSSQGYSVASCNRDYVTCSDPANDTGSMCLFHEVHADDLYDYKSEISYNIPSVMGESDFVFGDLDQLDTRNQPRNEILNDEFELLSSMESLEYHYSDNIEHEHDCKLTWLSSSCGDQNIDVIGMKSHFDTRVEQVQESRIIDYDYFEHDLFRNNASVTGTPTNDRTSVMDATLFAKTKKDSDMIGEINSLNTTPQTVEIGRCFDISDNTEVLQVAGVNCLAREPLNSGDLFDAENNDQKIESFGLYNDNNDHWDKIKEYEAQDIMKCNELAYEIASGARNSYSVNKFEEIEHSLYSPDWYFCNTNSSERVVHRSNGISSTLRKKYLADEVMESQVDSRCSDNASCDYLPELCKWDQKGKNATASNRMKDSLSLSYFLEDVSQKETSAPNKQKDSEVLMSKIMLPCVPSKEDIVSAAAINLDSDGKLNNGCLDLASSRLGVDKCEKGPTQDGETNDSCEKDVATDQSSKLECNEAHQASQCDTDHVYPPEHSRVRIEEEVKPEEDRIEIPKSKSQKKLLLRSVLGGATAVGLLFMFLNLRKNGGEKDAQPNKTSSHKNKEKIHKNSTKKVNRMSTTKEVYPAEKLELK
ncbi:unnamed protein product [Lathyrus oleraceus]